MTDLADKKAVVISALVCHSHVPMAVDCLGSLVRLCAENLRLQIHDDGTLTASDRDKLEDALGKHQLILRKNADERIQDEYGRFTEIIKLRKTFPLMLKAFDAVVYCPDAVFAYVDSDVLFLQRFANPFQLPNDQVNAIFMQDRASSYCLRSWQLALSPRVSLPAKINTGLIVARKAQIDFDLLEWFVGQPRHRGIPSMLEQTFWACWGKRVGCQVFDPQQVRVMREGEEERTLVAGHFTARTRALLSRYVERSEKILDTEALAVLRTIAPDNCGAGSLFRYEMTRLIRRVW